MSIWRDRSLLGILTAELVSLTGSALTFVALPWFVAVTAGFAAETGWVRAAEMAPVAILGIPAGSVIARLGAKRTMLVKLCAIGVVGLPLPIFLLATGLPWEAATIVIGGIGFFQPIVNAPILGILTVRTPAPLRPKVMTAVMTVASLAGPIGFVLASQALQRWISVETLFLVVAIGLLAAALVFARVLLRNGRSADPSVPVPA